MFEQNLMVQAADLSVWAALTNGLLSFFSPCILPLVPAYFAFLAGATLDQLMDKDRSGDRRRLLISTALFCAGFSFVFIMMGMASSALGKLLGEHSDVIRYAGGTIVIILGLHMIGIFRIKALDVEKRFEVVERPANILGLFVVGMAFGAGWTPCVGPFLGGALAVAANQDTALQGGGLLAVYSLGLAAPFMILAFFIDYLLGFLAKAKKVMKYILPTGGAIMILLGVALILDWL